jgi:hypothetical protein
VVLSNPCVATVFDDMKLGPDAPLSPLATDRANRPRSY